VTISAGAQMSLRRRFWASATVLHGSGFLRGNGPDHMPPHTTGDVAVGKDIGDKWSLRVTVLNVTNNTYLTGIENSFAGTHYANPREGTIQLRWKFNY
jgi:outer membrane receptor protein involved in Fe transport